jgi:hypothetical protein
MPCSKGSTWHRSKMQVHVACLAAEGTALHRIWPVNMPVQSNDKNRNFSCSAQVLLVHISYDNTLSTVYITNKKLYDKLRNTYRLLVGKPEGKRPLGRPRRRWVDNIRMDLGEVGWGCCGLDWSG